MALSQTQQQAIAAADPAVIRRALTRLRGQVAQGRWLSRRNVYAGDAAKALQAGLGQGGRLHPRHLQAYVAASIPMHCLDGWSYLGRALASHIQGEAPSAVHLAYYAELRAAASLLAAEAVGVVNRDHVVFGKRRNPAVISGPGTHVFAWDALEAWSSGAGSAIMLGRVVEPGDVSFEGWLSEFSTTATSNAVAREWLGDWGLDLRLMSVDHTARNFASYRPTGLKRWSDLRPLDVSRTVREFWAIFEPSGRSGFNELDRYLLRRGLEAAYRTLTGRNCRQAPADFRHRVTVVVERVSPSGGPASEWVDFLTRRTASNDPLILVEAGKRDEVGSEGQHMQVMARAALLLRLATGTAADALRGSRCAISDLRFWWEHVGEEAGLWDPTEWRPADPGSRMSDMWADVAVALDELRDWEEQATSGSATRRAWHLENAGTLLTLSGCQRIGLWGLSA